MLSQTWWCQHVDIYVDAEMVKQQHKKLSILSPDIDIMSMVPWPQQQDHGNKNMTTRTRQKEYGDMIITT